MAQQDLLPNGARRPIPPPQKKTAQQPCRGGEPLAECLAGGGGSGALVSPGRPTCPPRQKTFFYFFLKEKNEIYSRSRKLEANFRCTTFFCPCPATESLCPLCTAGGCLRAAVPASCSVFRSAGPGCRTHAALQEAATAFADEEFGEAQRLLKLVLRHNPDDGPALFMKQWVEKGPIKFVK